MIAAVVPVKALDTAKSRLLPGMDREQIAELSIAMMCDILEELQRVPALSRVAVVTPDATVARAAEASGAEVLLYREVGLNPSIESATAEVAPEADDAGLVILGDVATATAADITILLEALEGPGVALAPSSDGGTTALLRSPRSIIPARFDPDSAARHREAAARSAIPYRELPLPSLSIDIDVAEDIEEALQMSSLGKRTRAVLEEFEARPR